MLSCRARQAFVFPTVNGFTTFCDSEAETQDPGILHALAREVSLEFRCPVFCVLNHDDDILWYALYENGELMDEYDSYPGYFEGYFSLPKGGDATKLCRVLGTVHKEAKVEEILRKPHNERGYVVELDRHQDLVEALGLPKASVGFGYRYLERGEAPEGIEEGDLKRSPN